MYFDPVYMLIIVVSTVLGLVTQGYVNHTYRRWSQVPAGMGATGAEIARRILDSEGLYDVTIERVPGHLTDHYDPRRRYLGLSQDVYSGATVAAVGVAVTVGRGATLGAGTTLTRDAPPDQLTLSRAQQVSIAGWKRPAKKGKQ